MKVTVKEPNTALDFLLVTLQTASKTRVRKMLKFGAVLLDGAVIERPDHPLAAGQVIEIRKVEKPEGRLDPKQKGPSPILYEDEAIIVVQKPAGLLSIGTEKERDQTLHAMLYQYVEAAEEGRIYIVHRLDRDVAGLMVFAKTSQAKANLQMNWDQASKRYAALVVGKPPQPKGRIETYIEEISVYKVRVCGETADSKYAITEYQTLKEIPGYTLLDVNLLTGRRHQIRVHMAHMGCPIAGDRVYGEAIHGQSTILLFAYSLAFKHPISGEPMSFKLPIPNLYKQPPKSSGPLRKGSQQGPKKPGNRKSKRG